MAKILQHKWLLSEKLGRDVGLRVACIDFLENMEQAREEYLAYQRRDILNEMGAQTIGREIWDTISESQPPKQIVQRRIILPLTEQDLVEKAWVVPPKTIIFFGPPGTGKTHFAKAIAGALSWWFIEIAPSMLMVDGAEKMGANLRPIMEKSRNLEEAVIFIDEFEEIAGSRDEAIPGGQVHHQRISQTGAPAQKPGQQNPADLRHQLYPPAGCRPAAAGKVRLHYSGGRL